MNVFWPFRRFTISMIVSELHMLLQYVHFDFRIGLPPHDLRKLPPEQKKVESSSLKNLEKKLMSHCFKKTETSRRRISRSSSTTFHKKSHTFRNCSVISFHFICPVPAFCCLGVWSSWQDFTWASWFSKLLKLSFLSPSHTSPCVSLHF